MATTHVDSAVPNRYITREDLASRLQISIRKLDSMMSAGKLPAPIRLNRSIRWPPEVIDEWLEGLRDQRVGV